MAVLDVLEAYFEVTTACGQESVIYAIRMITDMIRNGLANNQQLCRMNDTRFGHHGTLDYYGLGERGLSVFNIQTYNIIYLRDESFLSRKFPKKTLFLVNIFTALETLDDIEA